MDLRYTHYLKAEELTNQAALIRAAGTPTDAGYRTARLLLAEADVHARLASAEKLVEMQAELHAKRAALIAEDIMDQLPAEES